jgi:hypothetical protein
VRALLRLPGRDLLLRRAGNLVGVILDLPTDPEWARSFLPAGAHPYAVFLPWG